MLARLKDIQLKMSERDQKILIVLVIAVALLATYWTIFRWFIPEYSSLKQAKNVVEADISQLQRTIGAGQDVEAKMLEKRRSIETLMKRFDWQVTKGDPLLVLGNQSQVTDRQFQLLSLNQGEINARNSIWEVPYTVKARGTTQSVQEYVTYLDRQDKALQPNYLRINYYDSFEAKRSDDVWLELELNAYGAQNAQETKERLIELEARGNIFSPTVSIVTDPIDPPSKVVPPKQQPPNQIPEDHESEEVSSERIPRYNFPSKQELER